MISDGQFNEFKLLINTGTIIINGYKTHIQLKCFVILNYIHKTLHLMIIIDTCYYIHNTRHSEDILKFIIYILLLKLVDRQTEKPFALKIYDIMQ